MRNSIEHTREIMFVRNRTCSQTCSDNVRYPSPLLHVVAIGYPLHAMFLDSQFSVANTKYQI